MNALFDALFADLARLGAERPAAVWLLPLALLPLVAAPRRRAAWADLTAVPPDALPVVTTTWTLSQVSPASRLRFLQCLDEAATDRPMAWASVEGVGVAPSIPTFGDRRASGHSIIGVALVEQSTFRAEALGRCWSRGRMLAWLANA